jgi:hypothetical protein
MLGSTRDGVTPLVGRLEEQSLLTSLLDDVATAGSHSIYVSQPHATAELIKHAAQGTLAETREAVS